ncbi:hypothetical protein [[Clostridium] colinum]|uniref:hypothetical protein n=1 Tax=[Clostridium] colinum TaxID=36835 RepID=UPI00202588D9|nr:hypothetical protein [[Clostridium] colinum]
MKRKKLLSISLFLIGLLSTGCNNSNNNDNSENTTMVENTTGSNVSNNINGVFDGYRYNTDDYNIESNTYDKNYYNGYEKTNNSSNNRFGPGMKGAENIKGNENKTTKQKISSDIKNIYNKEKNMYEDIKNSIKN